MLDLLAPTKQKKKLLFVGDSLSRNLNISVIKNVTDMDVKRAEAFAVAKDDPKARFPDKNFTEIVPKELEKDNYSVMVLQGGTNEVTNLDVSGNVTEKNRIPKRGNQTIFFENVSISTKKAWLKIRVWKR